MTSLDSPATFGQIADTLDDLALARVTAMIAEGRSPVEAWFSTATFNQYGNRKPDWAGPMVFEGVPTSDMRIIEPGGLSWRRLPWPLQDQELSQPAHEGSAPAGPVTLAERVDAGLVAELTGNQLRLPEGATAIWGAGFFDSGDIGDRARRHMAEGTKQGVSVDLTEMRLDLPDDPRELDAIVAGEAMLRILSARIGAATLVSIPAFEEARLQINGEIPMTSEALVASGGLVEDVTFQVVVPLTNFVAPQVIPLDPAPRASLSYGNGNTDLTSSAVDAATPLSKVDPSRLVPLGTGDDGRMQVADLDALVAGGAPARDLPLSHTPPPEWFEKRTYSEVTPKVIEPPDVHGRRRFHGHTAAWGSCHTARPDLCVDVPRGLDYDSFQGPRVETEVLCQDGTVLKAGPVIIDNVHPNLRASASDAAAHYHWTGSMVAAVRCYEDEHGLQVQGWVYPTATADDIVVLRGCSVSPDWRPRATARGGRGVVAMLGVPVTGFNLGLVASGGPEVDPVPDVEFDVDARWAEALTRLGRSDLVKQELSGVDARWFAALSRLGVIRDCSCGCNTCDA